jgi:hypothetical protein
MCIVLRISRFLRWRPCLYIRSCTRLCCSGGSRLGSKYSFQNQMSITRGNECAVWHSCLVGSLWINFFSIFGLIFSDHLWEMTCRGSGKSHFYGWLDIQLYKSLIPRDEEVETSIPGVYTSRRYDVKYLPNLYIHIIWPNWFLMIYCAL